MFSVVYIFYDENNKPLYIGSTIDFQRRLFKEHLNPKYKSHRPFGKWLHQGNIDKVSFRILEIVPDGKDLKKRLKMREFHYKTTLPRQRFGKLDGLQYQSLEYKLALRRKQRLEKNKDNPNFKPRGRKPPVTTQKHKERLARRRELNKLKKEKAGLEYKPRKLAYEYIPEVHYISEAKAKYLEHRRAMHKKRVEAAGKVYKPRMSRAQRSVVKND